MYYLVTVAIIALLGSACVCHFEEPIKNQISNDDAYTLSWSLNQEDKLIKFDLSVKTTGWVGFGISPDGRMPNSDMYIGYVKKDGKAVVEDRFAISKSLPPLDSALGGKDDLLNITGSIANGRTLLSFTRPLVTGDKYDIDIKQGQTYTLVFSYRYQGNPETEGGNYLVHSAIYAKNFVIYPNSGQSTNVQTLGEKYKDSKDVSSLKIQFDNVQIPVETTAYICRLFDINTMINKANKSVAKNTSYHAIGYDVKLDNSAFVHHITVSSCDYRNVFYTDGYIRCEDMPKDCRTIIFGWAPGQDTYEFPPEAGLMFGTLDTYFVLMQIHYNNPTLLPNQVDSSSFSFFYTPILRKNDIGLSFVQRISDLSIPPKLPSFKMSTNCPVKCFNEINPAGFTMISYAHHMHTIGKKMKVRITKDDGTFDDDTFRKDVYDFNNQGFTQIAYPFKRGYAINIECEWDSTSRAYTTVGGEGTDNEMCVFFYYYYPKENGLDVCLGFDDPTKDPYCKAATKQERVELSWAGGSANFLKLGFALVMVCIGMIWFA